MSIADALSVVVVDKEYLLKNAVLAQKTTTGTLIRVFREASQAEEPQPFFSKPTLHASP